MTNKLDGKTIYDRIINAITLKIENDSTFREKCEECKLFNKYGDITDKGISRLLNVSAAHVYNWATGSIPSGSTLISISNILNCSLDYLIGRSETLNYELNDIHVETGLSEPAIEKLREYATLSDKHRNHTHYLEFIASVNKEKLKKHGITVHLRHYDTILDLISFLITYQPNNMDTPLFEKLISVACSYNAQLIRYYVMDDVDREICDKAYKRAINRTENELVIEDLQAEYNNSLYDVVKEQKDIVFDPNREVNEPELFIFSKPIKEDANRKAPTDSDIKIAATSLQCYFHLIHSMQPDSVETQTIKLSNKLLKIIEQYFIEKKEETDISFVDDSKLPTKKK